MKEYARARIRVYGKVQGVWFRAETQKAAFNFGVAGWVRNNSDGSVEAVAEGDKNKITSLIDWCQNGSPLSKVDKVEVQWEVYRGEYKSFDVSY